jgi:hypothetical protein
MMMCKDTGVNGIHPKHNGVHGVHPMDNYWTKTVPGGIKLFTWWQIENEWQMLVYG